MPAPCASEYPLVRFSKSAAKSAALSIAWAWTRTGRCGVRGKAVAFGAADLEPTVTDARPGSTKATHSVTPRAVSAVVANSPMSFTVMLLRSRLSGEIARDFGSRGAGERERSFPHGSRLGSHLKLAIRIRQGNGKRAGPQFLEPDVLSRSSPPAPRRSSVSARP